MDSGDAKEAFPHHCDDPPFQRCLAWPIPSPIRWMKSRKLKLAVPEDWTHWMKHDFIKLRDAGLIFSSWEDTQQQLTERSVRLDSTKHDLPPQITRHKQAYVLLAMGRGRFDSDVRPLLNEIKIGKRHVSFHRSELDQWAAKLARSPTQLGEKPRRTWQQAAIRWSNETKHKADHENDNAKLIWLNKIVGKLYLDEIDRDVIDSIASKKMSEKGCAPVQSN